MQFFETKLVILLSIVSNKLKTQLEAAKDILEANDHGTFSVPALGLYPHQWLWDSCFIAIGLRHLDLERAKSEVLSLLRGQWSNGMLPNMIFNSAPKFRTDRQLWRSHVSPFAPVDIATSGITQPPMLAEAIYRIGQLMPKTERRSWYQQVYPSLLRYHQWLYKERSPKNNGLVVCVHPYESGMDNSPPWIVELSRSAMPWSIRLLKKAHLKPLLDIFRRDTHKVPPGQRMDTYDAVAYIYAVLKLRRKAYDIDAILKKPKLVVYDLGFNCILQRANAILEEIASEIGRQLPGSLKKNIALSGEALDELWSAEDSQYYSKSYRNNQLIGEPTIANLLTLYSGQISPERAGTIVGTMLDSSRFWLKHPLPSVPANSAYFDPIRYWQGPVWINMNWLIIDGLKRYGYDKEAEKLKQKSLDLLKSPGFYEYFNPVNGNPEGAEGFSWTAALAIDLLNN